MVVIETAASQDESANGTPLPVDYRAYSTATQVSLRKTWQVVLYLPCAYLTSVPL
jgi:hypothetical protein